MRDLTTAQIRVRDHAMAVNLGRCAWCDRQATNACHRLPEGQGGPYIAANLLPGCGSGTVGCHWRTEQRRELSYACGWLMKDGGDPAGRSARIAATPALVRTQLGPGWHILDWLDETGRQTWLPRLAEPGEVPAWMFPGTYADAVAALRGSTADYAEVVAALHARWTA